MSRIALALIAAGTLTGLIARRASAESPALSPADLRLQQYFYIDFPRRLESINNQIALAEAQSAYFQRRADLYGPMRSFHQYGATYLADQSAQLAVVAVREQLDCLRDQKTALWRERQAVAEGLLSAAR